MGGTTSSFQGIEPGGGHEPLSARDIWLYDAKTGIHTNLTDRAGEDRNPVLSPDGRTVYFLSERNGGSFNVYAFPLAQPREVKPITSFKTHPVRFLSMSDGGTLCYSYDGEIYTQQPDAYNSFIYVFSKWPDSVWLEGIGCNSRAIRSL